MIVIFNTMYDPDVEDMSEAIDAVTLYEWAIVDGSYGEGMYENWRIVNNLQKINNTHVSNCVVLFYTFLVAWVYLKVKYIFIMFRYPSQSCQKAIFYPFLRRKLLRVFLNYVNAFYNNTAVFRGSKLY